MEFAEILERKIRKDLESEYQNTHNQGRTNLNNPSSFNSYNSYDPVFSMQESLHSSLLEALAIKTFKPNKTSYDRFKSTPRPRPSHKFNETQLAAFTLLRTFNLNLSDNFNKKELKSAFRMAAKKTHPDMGYSPEHFRGVQDAYQLLKRLL